MFTGFNYTPSKFFSKNINFQEYKDIGEEICSEQKSEFQKNLKPFIKQDVINGTALQNECFPIFKKKRIFISHSHNDIDAVTAFAGWLFECFGLEAFVDAWAWEYSDDLLKEIDRKYCYQPRKQTYDYKTRNLTTSHVHMMLSVALAEMMDNAECVIFFNTSESVIKDKTTSPWIYYELLLATRLRRRKLLTESFSQEDSNFVTKYDVSRFLKELNKLTDAHLEEWLYCIEDNSRREPLSLLYDIVERRTQYEH
ncbi:MAG: hypothetical protein SPE30_03430 [Candidatus Treponema excrementipullorum]|nr:hypothetical protein [Candidatus Treponema excrementipullorum]